jgi:pimeloyl-ACP methyl ester carboxylesterase
MDRPLSQLIHFPFQTGAGSPTVMTLHRNNAYAESMREIGLAANPDGRVLGLQSTKGVYLGRDIVGYTWFVGPLTQPSPVHYGDAMLELERFFWDQIDRQEGDLAQLPFLIGIEQGATMALAMAAATPDLLSGVIAIDAIFPTVGGWEPPLAPLSGLPILLAGRPPAGELPPAVLTGDRLAETFRSWGGDVSLSEEAGDNLRVWLANQPVRSLDRTTAGA